MISSHDAARLAARGRQMRRRYVDPQDCQQAKVFRLEDATPEERDERMRLIAEARRQFEMNVAHRITRLEHTKATVIGRMAPGGGVEFDVYKVDGQQLELIEPCVTDEQLAHQIAAEIVNHGAPSINTALFGEPTAMLDLFPSGE